MTTNIIGRYAGAVARQHPLGLMKNTNGVVVKDIVAQREIAKAKIPKLVPTKQQVITPEKLLGQPAGSDCFNKGYMQTETFWDDKHNKKAMEIIDEFITPEGLRKDYRDKLNKEWTWANKPIEHCKKIRKELAELCNIDGTRKYIDILQKLGPGKNGF